MFGTRTLLAELVIFRWTGGVLAYRVEQHPLPDEVVPDAYVHSLAGRPRTVAPLLVRSTSWRFDDETQRLILTWAALPDPYLQHDAVLIHALDAPHKDWHQAAKTAAQHLGYLSQQDDVLRQAMDADEEMHAAFSPFEPR